MTKLLVLIIIAFVAYTVWRAVKRAERTRRPRPQIGERMVDCSQCGVHLPVSEAVESGGRYFCSDEHRRLYRE